VHRRQLAQLVASRHKFDGTQADRPFARSQSAC
jgi:hypothetical protein